MAAIDPEQCFWSVHSVSLYAGVSMHGAQLNISVWSLQLTQLHRYLKGVNLHHVTA